jgi:hypothetical protein
MRRRIYVNGKPAWSENEPAVARVQGHGGAQLGFFQGVVVVSRKPKADPEALPSIRIPPRLV